MAAKKGEVKQFIEKLPEKLSLASAFNPSADVGKNRKKINEIIEKMNELYSMVERGN